VNWYKPPYARFGNSITGIQKIRLLALLPILIAATVNTGYQYLRAIDIAGAIDADTWQGRYIDGLVSDYASPSVAHIIIAGLVHLVPVILAALMSGGIWERVFSTIRGRPFDIGVIYIALLFSLMMPPMASLFHVVFGMTFAIVLGKAVFGGEGKSFLNPALVGIAIVQISFPGALAENPVWGGVNGYAGTTLFAEFDAAGKAGLIWSDVDLWTAFIGNTQGLIGTTSVLAILIGGLILSYGHLASWRLIAGQITGVVIAATLFGLNGEGMFAMPWFWHLQLGGFALGAVFIATDPSSSSATNSGRWIQGILIGLLVVLIRVLNPSHPDGVVSALLLASMMAPMIDEVVMWFNIRRRAMNHG
jgi:Na+-transporting NADH:ubiquinone oxidoreductase subunit B